MDRLRPRLDRFVWPFAALSLLDLMKSHTMQFQFHQKVLFKHCDPAGIVFYPRFFEMMNDCVEAFFDTIGTPFESLHDAGGVPTAQISTTFHAPSRHGDRLVIALEVTRIGTSSLGLSLDASAGDHPRFSATSTLVYVDQTGRPQPWPSDIRTAMTPYLRSTQ